MFLSFYTMMNSRLCLTVLLVLFVSKEASCDFDEASFEAKKKEKNLFVLFVKDL